jgi:hypothetical protein
MTRFAVSLGASAILAVVVAAGCSSSSTSPNAGESNDAGSSGESSDVGSSVGPAADSAPSSSETDASSGDAKMPSPWVSLFDGALTSDWHMSTISNQPGHDDPGHFAVEGTSLVAYPGTDLGLLWNAKPTPADFVLEMEWKLSAADDNSGVFLRFPNVDSKGYNNTAWVAVDFGFEVQINEPGVPDGASQHTTGAIYSQSDQMFTRVVANAPGQWNQYSIRVEGQSYTVSLNGQQVTHFVNTAAAMTRGLASTPSVPSFFGLQTHTGNVAFRNIRIRAIP